MTKIPFYTSFLASVSLNNLGDLSSIFAGFRHMVSLQKS